MGDGVKQTYCRKAAHKTNDHPCQYISQIMYSKIQSAEGDQTCHNQHGDDYVKVATDHDHCQYGKGRGRVS